MPMIVGHDRLARLTGANLTAADDEGNLDTLLRHLLETLLERLFLR